MTNLQKSVRESAPKIMLVEDDPAIQRLLGYILETEGFQVFRCDSGKTAIDAFDTCAPDLVLLDLMLPDVDGIAVSRTLKTKVSARRTPILVVTAKQEEASRYDAFEGGADDFITKPFDPIELLYRIRVFLRLSSERLRAVQEVVERASLRLYPQRFIADVDGREVKLTKMEVLLLQFLMTHAGEVYSAETLAQQVFGAFKARGCTDDAVHAHVKNLRAKIENDPKHPTRLLTIGRKGYSFSL
jgi:DNA-binding response OmpR family regulator